jgi:hypothetical protein
MQLETYQGFPNHPVRNAYLPLAVRPKTVLHRFTALPAKRADHFRWGGLPTLGPLPDTQTAQKPHSVCQRLAPRRTPRQNYNPPQSPPRQCFEYVRLCHHGALRVRILRFATESVANRTVVSPLLSQADLATDAADFRLNARIWLLHLRFLRNGAAGRIEVLDGPNVSCHFEPQWCTTETLRHRMGTKNLPTQSPTIIANGVSKTPTAIAPPHARIVAAISRNKNQASIAEVFSKPRKPAKRSSFASRRITL